MDFTLTENQLEICSTIKKLCRKRLNENIFEDDEKAVFPLEKWKLCGSLGLPGIPVPEEYGGLGESMLTTALAIKTFGYACADEGLIFSLTAHLCTCLIPLVFFGSNEQKRKYLPRLVTGDFIGGNGITESEAGSDVTSMKTKVKKKDDYYILNGTKIFVTNAPSADLLVIYGKHEGGLKMADTSAFLLETDTAGFSLGQVFRKMGLRTSSTGEVVMEECMIHESRLLGRERLGLMVFNKSMFWERVLMSAYHIGAMEQQFNLALDYSNIRRQAGNPIKSYQGISHKLVDMYSKIETAKLLLYKVCSDYDNGQESIKDASLLKLVVSEAKVKNSLESVQIFGAAGYMKESLVEKQLRDSIAATIYSGTSEIQKKIVAENLERYDG